MSKRILYFGFLLAFLHVEGQQQRAPGSPVPLRGLDKYVDSVLQAFHVPGLSLVVVKDGQAVIARGYGLKRLGDTATVNAHTLFPIASNTKAFTALALAQLVESGKLRWDEPVISYLPWFRMSDPWVTAQLTVRDLLTHHSGIPAYAGDITIFPPSTYSRREIVEKLRQIPLVHSFRSTYAYDNILYLAAGEVIEAVSGLDWHDYISQRILQPLSMNETVDRLGDVRNNNFATPHMWQEGRVVPLDDFREEELGTAGDPCGGIVSNAVDMSKWLIAELDSGRVPGGSRIIASSAFNELWNIVTPQTVGTVPAVLAPAQPDFLGYALGVRVSNYGPYKTISHGGVLDGAVSQVLLVPRLRLGIAVLTNHERSGACLAIINHLLDIFMQRPAYNWLSGYRLLADSADARWSRAWAKAQVPPAAIDVDARSSASTTSGTAIPGRYHDELYGDVDIEARDSAIEVRFVQTPQFAGTLKPWNAITWKLNFRQPALKADSYVNFSFRPDGSVAGFRLKIIDPSCNFSFEGLEFKKIK